MTRNPHQTPADLGKTDRGPAAATSSALLAEFLTWQKEPAPPALDLEPAPINGEGFALSPSGLPFIPAREVVAFLAAVARGERIEGNADRAAFAFRLACAIAAGAHIDHQAEEERTR